MYLYPGRTKASTLTLVFKYALLLAFVWGNVLRPAPLSNPLPHRSNLEGFLPGRRSGGA